MAQVGKSKKERDKERDPDIEKDHYAKVKGANSAKGNSNCNYMYNYYLLYSLYIALMILKNN
jgi:hypothetical protein